MTGRIVAISGPTVRVELGGLTLYERVHVGKSMLTGEVVRLHRGGAVIQVYEDTRGLGIGEPVTATGSPLTVSLGPGLLGGIFDGLQRPLGKLRDEMGPFITSGRERAALDYDRKWRFTPLLKEGDTAAPLQEIGYFDEGRFRHYIRHEGAVQQRLARISSGEMTLDSPLADWPGGSAGGCIPWPVRAPRPFRRKLAPSTPLVTGQRVVDFLFPIARGGTAILPGGFGTGKTVLEQTIAKFADVDMVVYVGCGERGNEMAEMIEEFMDLKDPWTGSSLMERTILVINTSNMPVAAREASIYTAVSMAEYYRDMGYHVLFLADSLSRWAEALREISASLEEMPGEEGYPTYLASRLSSFMERAGVVETPAGKTGSLSMILSVSPPGGDLTEPVTQACMRTAGAFLMLDTSLAHARHFPAINWFQSYSLYARDVSRRFEEEAAQEWADLLQWCRATLRQEESLREVAEIVGLEGLQDADRLLMEVSRMIRDMFLSQNSYTEDAFSAPAATLSIIRGIKGFFDRVQGELQAGMPLEEALRGTDAPR